jgi:hypothetical protein
MSEKRITQNLLLPDLKFFKEEHRKGKKLRIIYCEKVSTHEVCTRCISKCTKDL